MGRKVNKKSVHSQANFWNSLVDNELTYMQYYERLVEIGVSMFKWNNLPSSIDERFLELALFTDGRALFFKDEDLGDYLCLRVTLGGRLDVYNIPMTRRAYAPNGYNKTYDNTNSVVIFNNYLHNNSALDVLEYSKRLYNIDRTIDVNVGAQKTPILLMCDDKQKLTVENMYKEYDGNSPVIYGYKNGDLMNSIKSLQTGAPFIAPQLYDLRTNLWNEALTFMGVNNMPETKKERMLVDEVMTKQGGTFGARFSKLAMRQMACKQINEMFGLNISVEYRTPEEIADRFNGSVGAVDE